MLGSKDVIFGIVDKKMSTRNGHQQTNRVKAFSLIP